MRYIIITGICLFFLAGPVLAKDVYVTDSIKATFRNGPGNDKKPLKMIASGEKMTLIEAQESWSKVRLPDGTEGWMQNQWLTEEVPHSIQYVTVQKNYDELLLKFNQLKQAHDGLAEENKKLKETPAGANAGENGAVQGNGEPRIDPAQYLKLQDELNKVKAALDQKVRDLDSANDRIKWYYIAWFMIGSGVLLIGVLLGLAIRQKKRTYFIG